jgi:NADPH-dependent glutamate synthase beta subunit-like oxidoreductase
MKSLSGKTSMHFIGTGAPQRDTGRRRRGADPFIHIGIDWLSNVAFGHVGKISKRVIVLGGGNTAMDCCRSARRLGGAEQVTVVVRSAFHVMKASGGKKMRCPKASSSTTGRRRNS